MENHRKLVWIILFACVASFMISTVSATVTSSYSSYDATPTTSTFIHTHPSDEADGAYSSAYGQALNFTTGGFLYSAKFYMAKSIGSPNGAIQAEAYLGTGTFGTDMVPTGTAVAVSTNTVNVTAMGALPIAYTFYFDATYAVNAGDEICIVAILYNATTIDIDNRIAIDENNAGAIGNGIHYHDNAWSANGFDISMVAYVVDTYGGAYGGSTWTPDDPTEGLIDSFANFIVPLAILLLPSILFIIFFKRADKWLILIGLAIGAGLGYYFSVIPVWLVFLVAIGLIGLAYSEVRRNG